MEVIVKEAGSRVGRVIKEYFQKHIEKGGG